MRRILLTGLFAAIVPANAEVVYPAKSSAIAPILDLAVRDGHAFVLHQSALAVSTDGGVNWARHKVPETPRSIYFLDEMRGWLVAADGLYQTPDGANKWRRILKSKDLLRCWFTDLAHGFAIGNRKAAFETTDGGKTWHQFEAATGVLSDPERTSFTSISFSGRTGFISGYHTPKRPAQDSTGRQWPQLGILIQTVDGGETWKPTASAVFGRLAQSHIRGRTAALVLQFDFEFQWPSEVYRIDLPTGETKRAYREENRRVCAARVLAGGAVLVAATHQGKGRTEGPRPLEVTLEGQALLIDDRLTASACVLQQEGLFLWLATDEGFVERLVLP